MTLRTVVEVALHFESFRNVDLFHQGLYHLKTRLYREDGEQRILAVPHSHFTCPSQVEPKAAKSSRTDHHHLIPAHITEDQCSFSTRSFLIRYCEEEVELDDIGQFRIEIGAEEAFQAPLLLEVDLMFADLTQHGGADRFGEQPDVDSTEFKSVSTQLLRIHGVERGSHEFCPIVFDEFHFCLANLIVHSVVVDLRLRLRPMDPVLPRSRPTKPGRGAAVSPEPPLAAALPTAPAPQRVSLSLAECLFGGGRRSRETLLQAAEELYEQHLGVLTESYRQQAAWFEMICGKCLAPAQREVFGDAALVAPLQLPHLGSEHPASSSGGEKSLRNGHSPLAKTLIQRLGPRMDERTIAEHLAYDINLVSCQILEMWHKVLNIMSYACREITLLLRMSWEERIIDQWAVTIMRDTMREPLATPKDPCIGDAHDQLAERLRRTAKPRPLEPTAVEDVSLIPVLEQRPVLFEQRYVALSGPGAGNGLVPMPSPNPRIPSAPKEYRGVHLFVLVHGFQGNSFDMRLMKNNLALLYPDAIFLCSNSNEDNTEGDFNEMGIRLAQEVVNYICDWCPGSALGRLSFIAHSIGGLIVRSALPLLHEYSSKMFTLLTFSTPHVGYFLKNISLFHMGLRVLQSWRQSTCLAQLSMTDNQDPRETFLYRLSQARGFEFFQNVVLVSCPSDQYSPFDSARVEVGGMLDKHSNKDAYAEMVHNIWEHITPEKVIRFDVNFNIPEKNLDTFIGRAAHIQFLECQPIMKMIIHNYSCLFR